MWVGEREPFAETSETESPKAGTDAPGSWASRSLGEGIVSLWRETVACRAAMSRPPGGPAEKSGVVAIRRPIRQGTCRENLSCGNRKRAAGLPGRESADKMRLVAMVARVDCHRSSFLSRLSARVCLIACRGRDFPSKALGRWRRCRLGSKRGLRVGVPAVVPRGSVRIFVARCLAELAQAWITLSGARLALASRAQDGGPKLVGCAHDDLCPVFAQKRNVAEAPAHDDAVGSGVRRGLHVHL